MAESFLRLPARDQREILTTMASRLRLPAAVLEKDVWICWVLQHLFDMPGALPTVFKGGTSLSKAFNLVQRISEDVDITIDTSSEFATLPDDASGSAVRRRKLEIEKYVHGYIEKKLVRHFANRAEKELGQRKIQFEVQGDEALFIAYPGVIEGDDYIQERVLVEMGGRNVTEPNQQVRIKTYIAADKSLKGLALPEATVTVLSPQRTFWEKVTLIHAECHRPEFKKSGDRIFRHWYDVAQICGTDVVNAAVRNVELLESVVQVKQRMYRNSWSNYQDCLKKRFVLVPGEDALQELRADYQKMMGSGMFFEGATPSFESVMEHILELQSRLNG